MYTITHDLSLLPYNTFGMDVKASTFIEYDNEQDLRVIFSLPEVRSAKKILHIGMGSNLLFDGDYDGVILHSRIKGRRVIADDGETVIVEIGAGEVWDEVCGWAVSNDWSGAENLTAIPGEMGAAAVQNIGAYGAEIKDLILRVTAYDTNTEEVRTFSLLECRYGYRHSIFKEPEFKGRYVVTSVLLRLQRTPAFNLEYGNIRQAMEGKELTLSNVRQAIASIRQAKLPDPAKIGNAGSFFKNPVVSRAMYEHLLAQYPAMPHYHVDDEHEKIPAGWLIEQCGWKGRRHGQAGVYEKQCLVLVNHGGATPQQLVELCQLIVDSVRTTFAIDIEPEVNIIR